MSEDGHFTPLFEVVASRESVGTGCFTPLSVVEALEVGAPGFSTATELVKVDVEAIFVAAFLVPVAIYILREKLLVLVYYVFLKFL